MAGDASAEEVGMSVFTARTRVGDRIHRRARNTL
jgi:hypothetical protein